MTKPLAQEFASDFARAYSSGQLDAVLAMYTQDAVLVDAHGIEHRGKTSIAKVLRSGLDAGAVMSSKPKQCVEYGDIAVLRNDFDVKIAGQVAFKSTSFEVLLFDGQAWKLAIDLPYAQPHSRRASS
jgi:ketosteroid isomerase-like protein